MHILDELKWRGLVNQVSDEAGLRDYLSTPGRALYCGFDPTADSLHVGNLVPLLSLVRFKKAGHCPLYLLGGATGRIGDPSGKDKEREFLDEAALDAQAAKIQAQINAFVSRNTGEPADVVNNYDWTRTMSALDLLRDVGKHFTVNWMLQKDSVRSRIEREDTGISYTEFSYMVLQGNDFHHLYKTRGCALQIGGGDQWGNITAGCELIRRKEGGAGFALTFPLITTASGKKFGKSEKGAIFLSADKTSPYAFYQYFINADDADVIRFCKYFTFLTQAEIADLEQATAAEPHLRRAQKALADAVTILVHGEDELKKVHAATQALFGSGDLTQVDPATLRQALESAPTITVPKTAIPDLPQLLVDLGLAKSKGEARKAVQAGGVYLNNERAASP
ncbi:MAG: tyrosine--tRNA ligase, partial [Desulfovibrionaceae bacterium]